LVILIVTRIEDARYGKLKDIVTVIFNITVYSSEIEGRNGTGIKKFWLSAVMKRRLEMNRITSKNSVAVTAPSFQS
jgi:hypothetical protein